MRSVLAGGLDIGGDEAADSGPPINLETYYTEAGMDYRAWSRAFNMHFGYWRWPQNPFALEAMLEEMSRQVFRRLAPADGDRLLDLGCGVGAPARALIAGHSVAVTAVTRVPWQIAMAHDLGPGTAPRGTVEWLLADYTATGLPSTFYQGAFSIEASCHAAGVDKELFVRECARLLVPGARLVVADGFMRRSDGMPRWYAALLRLHDPQLGGRMLRRSGRVHRLPRTARLRGRVDGEPLLAYCAQRSSRAARDPEIPRRRVAAAADAA